MAYQLHRITVLVIEDNQPMLDIVKSLLTTFGVGQVVGAADGEIGYKRYCEYNPDIIIADWMMKPMDGISFTRRVRGDEHGPNQFVPIVLMTGFSEKRRVFQARDAGVTEFLVKPFNARDLYKRLVQVIERPRQFVRAGEFFGPDRRRRKDSAFQGPYRRETDYQNPDVGAALQLKQAEAHSRLHKLRGDAGLGKGDKFNLGNGE
jgi:two-component system chemotaxis response regulator CheY